MARTPCRVAGHALVATSPGTDANAVVRMRSADALVRCLRRPGPECCPAPPIGNVGNGPLGVDLSVRIFRRCRGGGAVANKGAQMGLSNVCGEITCIPGGDFQLSHHPHDEDPDQIRQRSS